MSPRKRKAKAVEVAVRAEPAIDPVEPAPPEPAPVFTRRHAITLAGVALLVALIESALGLYQPRMVAGDADWTSAADYVRGQLEPDDLIVFAPAWIDPVGRRFLGDRMPIEMVARPDEDLYSRIFELSVRDAHAPVVANLKVADERRFGKVTVRRYDKTAARKLYDFTEKFATAKVSTRAVVTGARGTVGDEPCPFSGRAALCKGARVEPRVLEIDYRPRLGVLAPMIANKTTRIEYEGVPGGGTLVGYVGLHDYYARKNGDALVMFHVRVDETRSVTVPLRNPRQDGEGWTRFDLPLDAGPHKVVFELETDDARYRLPGFHAEVRFP